MVIDLSPYVLLIENDKSSEIILFNTINSCIVTLCNNFFYENKLELEYLSEDEITFLKKNKFFVSKNEVLNELNKIKFSDDTLNITISLTELCNLSCLYCYQNDFNSNSVISNEVIDCIINYINIVIEKSQKIQFLVINIIGGEPLIAYNELKYLLKSLRTIENLKIKIIIDTNGTLLSDEILNDLINFDTIISITLTDKSDHNEVRCFKNNKGSYDEILQNLKSLREYFLSDNINLNIRYNCHHNNIQILSSFYNNLKVELQYPFFLELAYLQNYEFNTFKNTLDIKEFKKIKTNFEMNTFPENFNSDINLSTFDCSAFSDYGIKVFSTGELGLCNAWNYKKRFHNIKDISNISDIDLILGKYKKKKNISENEKCLNCKYLFLCGGFKFCKGECQCNFIDYDIDTYIRNFIYLKGGEYQ